MAKQKWSKIFKEIDGFYAQIEKRELNDPEVNLYETIIHKVVQRDRIIKKHFLTDNEIETYVKEHKAADLIFKRIKAEVRAKRLVINRIAKGKGFEKLEQKSEISKYRALVIGNYIDVSSIFQEIPENISLCNYEKVAEYYKKKITSGKHTEAELEMLESFYNQWHSKQLELNNRWLALTGLELDFSIIPRLGEIDKWKAPVPIRPAWSNKLYSLEARQMGRSPALRNDNSNSNNLNSLAESESGEGMEVGEETACSSCEIDKLYDLAGGRKLKQPGTEDRLYTFPGTLNRHENIFYDYSIIIPVECIDNSCQDTIIGPDPRDLLPALVLAGKAKTVLEFLDDVGLSQVLGKYSTGRRVVDDINDLLVRIENLFNAPVWKVRQEKKELRKMAALMRQVSRTQMFLNQLSGEDPAIYLEALVQAINNFPRYARKDTVMPTTNSDNKLTDKTLYFPNDNKSYYSRNNQAGHINVPDAQGYITSGPYMDELDVTPGWKWKLKDAQRYDLRNYVIWLGDVFYNKLNAILEASTHMKNAVQSYAGRYTQFQTDFEQLAAGIVNNAAAALSYLLQEIAEQITLPVETNGEGSMRLALQVVFRQHWFPESYVMGKLVGYKNLIPNQKETLKRRTFIKTTRETTTAEEFATARQDDYSQSQKETSEVIKETSQAFNFTQNASGHYDVKVWGVEGETTIDMGLSQKSKAVQNMVSESAMKGSAKYSEKREIKIKELTEVEDLQEITSELQNANQEITANYFYYQLLRQYRVTIALNDLRPVLLRTRDVPSPTEIDDHFISTYAHILLHHLPNQLSVDAQESADSLDLYARTLIRRRAEMDQRSAEFEVFRDAEIPPIDEKDKYNAYREEYRSKERVLSEARQAFIAAEEQYAIIRAKMNRVLSHVRENICHYMQYIWQDSPKVDQDKILQKETFCGEKLPRITRGLMRQGYFGNEEIFDYTGESMELFEAYLLNLRPGDEILSQFIFAAGEPLQASTGDEQKLEHQYIRSESITFQDATVSGNAPEESVDYTVNYRRGSITFINHLDDTVPEPKIRYESYENLAETSLFQYLERYYTPEDTEILIDQIISMAFVEDPVNPEEVLSTRSVQIAQDALVLETMPGQVPLLEAFKMAHRMLDVQRACLENVHLKERISDRPWKSDGEDTYAVRRYDGDVPPEREVTEES